VLWLRRQNFLLSTLPPTERGRFASQEWRHMLDPFVRRLSAQAEQVINPLESLAVARSKQEQLSVAKELGFSVPRTLITNNRGSILEFCRQSEAVCKTFTPFNMGWGVDQRVMYTRPLSVDDATLLDEFMAAPLIVQERIRKRFEVRTLFVGEEHFGVSLQSGYEKLGSVDWREHDLDDLEAAVYRHDRALHLKCLQMMKHFDIPTASFDFIVSESGEIFFLEFNEEGNFLFLDYIHKKSVAVNAVTKMLAPSITAQLEVRSWPELWRELAEILHAEANTDIGYRRLGCL
jgi:hypothetical protein